MHAYEKPKTLGHLPIVLTGPELLSIISCVTLHSAQITITNYCANLCKFEVSLFTLGRDMAPKKQGRPRWIILG